MNLNHLRYFLTVASTGSFSRAAGQEGVTQPTVSSGVMELERALGVKLFNRGSRQVALTMEGRELVNYAMQIQDLVAEARQQLGERRLELVPGMVCTDRYPQLSDAFHLYGAPPLSLPQPVDPGPGSTPEQSEARR